MSNPAVPNPFQSARRVIGVNVMLKPEDIMTVCSLPREQIERLMDRHGSSIAVQMLAAGQNAAVQIIHQEGAQE